MSEITPVQGQSKGKAIAGMVFGIASIVLSWAYGAGLIPAIIGLILSSQCSKQGDQSAFTKTGKITSVSGLILSIILGFIMIMVIVVGTAAYLEEAGAI